MIIHESKAQECPLCFVKYSHNGVVVFACWQNGVITCHLASTALPIASFDALHKGAVISCDVSSNTSQLFATDYSGTGIVWDCERGEAITSFTENTLLESSNFSSDDRLVLYSLHKKFRMPSVFNALRDLRQPEKAISYIALPNCYLSKTIFANDSHILSALDNGHVVQHDLRNCNNQQTMDDLRDSSQLSRKLHNSQITQITCNPQHQIFMTSSKDKHCKIFDFESLEVFMDLNYGEEANGCAIHPNSKIVAVVGGQDVLQVTTTGHKSDQFASKFFYLPTGENFGQIKSHFGTPNACAFAPSGDSFASGGIDAFLKVHDLNEDNDFNSYEANIIDALNNQIEVLQ
ncbi:MAG: Eukaryotic translation initiation factor 3 subunit I [Marteilia pararefringens]